MTIRPNRTMDIRKPICGFHELTHKSELPFLNYFNSTRGYKLNCILLVKI